MADEYIRRDAAMKAAASQYGACRSPAQNRMIDEIRNKIRRMPAANVAEVVHGKWENGNPICPVCGENKFKDLDADIWCDWQPDFCPNCGAKMDGGDKTCG